MTEEHALPQPKGKNNKKGVLGLVLMLLILLALAAAGWFGWQFWQDNQQQQLQMEQQIAQLKSSQMAAGDANETRADSVGERLSFLEKQVLQQSEKLDQFDTAGQTFWMLNEAKSLASLASQRLLLTSDLTATLALLKTSDEALARIDDPKVLLARRGLAADMERVRSAQQLDVTGLLLRLGALIDGLQQITLPELTNQVEKPKTSKSKPAQHKPWWQRLVNKLPVSVQRYDADLPLPLKPTQLAQVRLALSMDFQEAQLALLQAKPKVYRQALKQAKNTLTGYFSVEDTRVKGLLDAISELEDTDVEQALPKIGSGLDAIKTLLETEKATSTLPKIKTPAMQKKTQKNQQSPEKKHKQGGEA